MAVDKWGNVYFSDYENSAVRLINTTTITSIISGLYTSVHYTGDAGPASLATFYNPYFLTMDPAGQMVEAGQAPSLPPWRAHGGKISCRAAYRVMGNHLLPDEKETAFAGERC